MFIRGNISSNLQRNFEYRAILSIKVVAAPTYSGNTFFPNILLNDEEWKNWDEKCHAYNFSVITWLHLSEITFNFRVEVKTASCIILSWPF